MQSDVPEIVKVEAYQRLIMQNHANDFGDELVLVTGYSRTDLKGILKGRLHFGQMQGQQRMAAQQMINLNLIQVMASRMWL